MKDHGYSSENKHNKSNGEVPAKRRYAQFLYDISLEDDEVNRLGLWVDIPRQDADYQKKVNVCNRVCFTGPKVYLYSRAVQKYVLSKSSSFVVFCRHKYEHSEEL